MHVEKSQSGTPHPAEVVFGGLEVVASEKEWEDENLNLCRLGTGTL